MSSAIAHTAHHSFTSPLASVQKGLGQVQSWFTAAFTPATPRVLSKHEEAEKVRAMAIALMQDDPAFANDLFAAADRHEGQ